MMEKDREIVSGIVFGSVRIADYPKMILKI